MHHAARAIFVKSLFSKIPPPFAGHIGADAPDYTIFSEYRLFPR